MSAIKTVLTMDMAALAHALYRFWAWWLGELLAVLPSALFQARGEKASLVAEYAGERLVFREYRAGAAVPIPFSGAPEKLLPRASFSLPASEVLVREIALPRMPLAEIRKVAAIDIDRLTPFRAEDVIFDLEPLENSEEGVAAVALAVVERRRLMECVSQLHQEIGAMPRKVCVVDHALNVPRFDFLKALALAEGRSGGNQLRSLLWLMVALLLAANFALYIVRDCESVRALSDQVEAQQTSVAVVNALRRKVEMETERRRLLLQWRERTAPLPILAAVTRALPDGAYIKKFEWDGAVLRLTGSAKLGLDIARSLRASPMLHDARFSPSIKPSQDGSFIVIIRPQMDGRR